MLVGFGVGFSYRDQSAFCLPPVHMTQESMAISMALLNLGAAVLNVVFAGCIRFGRICLGIIIRLVSSSFPNSTPCGV